MTESKTPISDKLEAMTPVDALGKKAIALARKLEIANAELRAAISAVHLTLDQRISAEREKNAVILENLDRLYNPLTGILTGDKSRPNLELKLIPEIRVQDFANEHGLIMEVVERPANRMPHFKLFYACFKNVEVSAPGVLISEFGDGDTEADAISDYIGRISNKDIVINARSEEERRISVPKLKYQGGGW